MCQTAGLAYGNPGAAPLQTASNPARSGTITRVVQHPLPL
jgi:hypothetical protein